MRHRGFLGVLVLVIAVSVGGGTPVFAADAGLVGDWDGPTIVVRTYAPADVRADLRTARRTAAGILSRERIGVSWVECGVPADGVPAPAPCRAPLGSNELVVRMVAAGPSAGGTGADALGFAFVDMASGGGSLATVYTDRVRTMAQAAGVGVGEILGRAIAHEIGHLLLGTNRHAPQGLMRAAWTGAELRRDRATQWWFDRAEGELMRHTIASRRSDSAAGPGGLSAHFSHSE